MIISKIMGGIGNQLFQYATGRRLAHKLNTEFKIENNFFKDANFRSYALNQFNIKENFATNEEIAKLIQKNKESKVGIEKNFENFKQPTVFMPEVLNYPDDVYLYGYWQNENYFIDIEDILRDEFTLKNPISRGGGIWREKIVSADCAVSLHVRHGDYLYHPDIEKNVLPIEYYFDCVNILKQKLKKFTLFVFSDDLNWVKRNLRLDVPMEFVEGVEKDVEEMYLMSLCKHNVIANSTFSWWGAWLNRNPEKLVLLPDPWLNDPEGMECKQDRSLKGGLKVPVDFNKQNIIKEKPFFSIILLVDNNFSTLNECLGSILSQDYKYFEVIIIDNASVDGGDDFCQQVAKTRNNVTFIKIYDKINNGTAWNMGLNISQGEEILFLKGNDRILSNSLTSLYIGKFNRHIDIMHSVSWITEDENGDLIAKIDAPLHNFRGTTRVNIDDITMIKILTNQEINTFLGTKLFNRNFLVKNDIKFNEKSENNSVIELLFLTECFSHTSDYLFTSSTFYIKPKD